MLKGSQAGQGPAEPLPHSLSKFAAPIEWPSVFLVLGIDGCNDGPRRNQQHSDVEVLTHDVSLCRIILKGNAGCRSPA